MTTKIYGTPSCTYCGAAKALLKSNNIEFEYIDIREGSNKADLELLVGSVVKTVPQIILNGEYIGGFVELQAKLK